MTSLLLDLYHAAATLTENELYNVVVDIIVKITKSRIGFFHQVDPERGTVSLTAWNHVALQKCQASCDDHYPLNQAGVWVDCIKQQSPVVYNRFEQVPERKGLPPGHVPLRRFMGVPVWVGDQIRYVFGVGNKRARYTDNDVRRLQMVGDEWSKIRHYRQAEEALREKETKFSHLFENMVEAFAYHKVILDGETPTDYIFLEANRAFEDLTGLKRDTIVGKRVTQVLPGVQDDPMDWIGRYGQVALEQEPIQFEQYSAPLGRWYAITAYSPQKMYFCTVFQDITQQRESQIRIEHLNSMLYTIRNINQLITMEKDVDRLISESCRTLVNIREYYRAWIIIAGRDGVVAHAAELGFGKPFHQLIKNKKKWQPPACWSRIMSDPEELMIASPQSDCLGCPLLSVESEQEPQACLLKRLEYAGKVIGAIAVVVPTKFAVDQQEQTLFAEIASDIALGVYNLGHEDRSRETERRLATLMDNMPGMAYSCLNEESWPMSFVSSGSRQLTGYNADSFVKGEISYRQVIHPEYRDAVWRQVQTALADRVPFQIEYPIVTAAAEEKWVWEKGRGVFTGHNRLVAVEGFITDISERKRAEEEIAGLARFPQENPNPVFRVDREGQALFTNDAAQRCRKIWGGELPLSMRLLCEEAIAAGEPLLLEERCGEYLFVFDISPVPESGYTNIYGRDITTQRAREDEIKTLNRELEQGVRERTSELEQVNEVLVSQNQDLEQSRAALRDNERRFRTLVDLAPDIIFRLDERGRLVYISPAVKQLEFEPPELTDTLLLSLVHPDDREQYRRCFTDHIADSRLVRNLNVRLLTKTGQYHDFELRFSNIRLNSLQGGEGSDLERGGSKISVLQGIARDISVMKQQQEKLRKAQEEAEKANRAKSAFLANMSHEIRTPMNAILGMNYLLQKTPLSNKQHGYSKKMEYASNSLLNIIDDILDFSKIEAGKVTLESIPFDLNEVIDHVCRIVHLKTQEKGLEFNFEVDENVPHRLIGDPKRLGQVLLNLASNAVKFTEKGNILVTIRVESKNADQAVLLFSVTDTGVGMTAEQQQGVFNAFAQADSTTTRKFGGTGLGLAITRDLVNMMEGKIEVSSTVGQGSQFVVTVPFTYESNTPPQLNQWQHDLADIRVLIIDDNRHVRRLLRKYFKLFSIPASTVKTGGQGVQALRTAETAGDQPYDLVLIDWKMPGENGLSVIREIKADNGLRRIPKIIMCSAYSKEMIVGDEEPELFDGFINKPFSPSSLFDGISDVINRQHQSLPPSPQPIIQPPSYQLDGLNILLAEDNEINQQVAKELIKAEKGRITVANNGRLAFEMLQTNATDHEFDLILMDLQMPKMNGFEAARKIRQLHAYRDIPIIAMTADVMPHIQEQVLEAGMNDYVAKPIIPHDLYAAIVKWIPRVGSTGHIRDLLRDEEEMVELPDHLPGIDIQQALERMRGNTASLLTLWRKFAGNQRSSWATIRDAVARRDADAVKQGAHALKGAAGNIGAMSVAALCEKIEAGALRSSWRTVETECQLLDHALNEVCSAIQALDETPAPAAASDLRSFDPKDETARNLFHELSAYLEARDTEAENVMRRIMTEYRDTDIQERLCVLQSYVDRYSFADALGVLRGIMS